MIMWIAALVLIAATVFSGYRQGAIRAALTFVGLLVALVLAVPFGPMFEWFFPLIGFKDPITPKFGAPVIAFVALSLVFKGLAAFIHRKVEYYYRYNRDDASRAVWEVLQARVGACVGALNGTVYFLVFALLIAVFGYTTIQIGGGTESSSKVLSFVGRAAEDLKATQMDRVVAPLNPAPTNYFNTADTLGLLYHNRGLLDRLQSYPVFAAMGQQAIYKSLGADKDLQSLLRNGGSFEEVLANPTVREVVSNTDLVTKVMEVDVLDLKEYLETGVSPKFSQEKLLGRWGYDALGSVHLTKRLKRDVGAQMWFRVKNELTERFDDASLVFYHDNTWKFLLATNMDGASSPMISSAVRLPNGQIQTNRVARWLNTNALNSAKGKWSGSAPNYLLTVETKAGPMTAEGRLENDRLSFSLLGNALVFKPLPD